MKKSEPIQNNDTICPDKTEASSFDPNIFSENLKYYRKARKLTQDDVASLLQINRSTYTYYELGKSTPNFENLIALSDLFGVSIDHLLRIRHQ